MSETRDDLREALALRDELATYATQLTRMETQAGLAGPDTSVRVKDPAFLAQLLIRARAALDVRVRCNLAEQRDTALVQVSALQAEVERLQKVEGEREKGRVTSSPCWSDKPEPQSVSALRATITSRGPAEITLTDNDRAVLAAMSDRGEDFGYMTFGTIAADSGVDRKSVRRIVRRLARAGYTEYASGLWTEDGTPAGAGYAITAAGRKAIRAPSSAPCDRSGEAGETSGLDPQGESTVTGAARQAHIPHPLHTHPNPKREDR